eukprot:712832-Rhodomonas_salina.1
MHSISGAHPPPQQPRTAHHQAPHPGLQHGLPLRRPLLLALALPRSCAACPAHRNAGPPRRRKERVAAAAAAATEAR